MNSWLPDEVAIEIDARSHLRGFLYAPEQARGVVLFLHGSGSSRFAAINNRIARLLAEKGFAVVLIDLLTAWEEQTDAITRELRFNIGMLADRVVAALDWVAEHPALSRLPVGLFGASTGGAAALLAAAQRPERVSAVVCGGRPDLACDYLKQVRTPTLMIIGHEDVPVPEWSQHAALGAWPPVQLVSVTGASHLSEELGACEQVGQQAADWFTRYSTRASEPPPLSTAPGRGTEMARH